MQIQRIQTLYLIISLLAAIVSLTGNWLRIDPQTVVTVQNNIPLLILAVLATLLPLIDICLYRNLRRQQLVGKLSALFALISIGYVVALSYLGPNPEAEVCIMAPVCMAVSGIFDCLAVRSMARDEKLLKAADRLR